MKLEVLSWFFEFLLKLLGKIIEVVFRVILLCLPLGLYLMLIQFRNGGSKVSNLSVYTNDNSVWQFVFPGFMLVSVDQNQMKNNIKKIRDNIQEWIKTNKYLLAFLLSSIIVIFLILNYIK